MLDKRTALLRIGGYLIYVLLIAGGVFGFTYFVNGGLHGLNVKPFTSLHQDKQWEAFIGDLPLIDGHPDYGKANWQSYTELAASQEGQENENVFWLRLNLHTGLPASLDPQLNIRDIMLTEIYLDEQKVFDLNIVDRSKPAHETLEWNTFPLPADYSGKTLYLRMFPAEKGLAIGQLLLGEGKDWMIETLKRDTLKLTLAVCFLFLFFIAAGAYLLYNREALHLYFAILCLSSCYYSFFQSSVIKLYLLLPVPSFFVDIAIPVGTFAFLGMLGHLTHGLVRRAFRIAAKLMLLFLAVSLILSLLNKQEYLQTLYLVHTAIVIAIMLSSVFVLIQLRKDFNSETFWLFAGFCCFGFFSTGRYLFMLNQRIHDKINELFPIFVYYWKDDLFFVGVFLFVLCLGMVIISRLRDVYRQVQIYADELEQKNVRLEQMDKIKDDFLEETSHELRTPLHGIIGLTESLLDGEAGMLSPKAQYNLQLVIASGKRLQRLVNDILDIARLRHKDIVLQLEPVKVKDIIGIVLAVFEPLLRGKPVTLRSRTYDDLPLVLADPNRLQQILYNLVGNAVKFTTSGEIAINANVEDSRLRIIVADTGIGIPQDKLTAIFEPFERADTSPGIEGTGLGLPLTKKLIELHGGAITIYSEPGEGTRCFFTLPLADASLHTERDIAQSPEPPIASPPADFGEVSAASLELKQNLPLQGEAKNDPDDSAVILLVDDEPVNIQVLDSYLAHEQVTLHRAYSGEEALASIKRSKPDLVLLDVMLPDRNGYDVCQTIRESYSASELPVILLTAKSQLADLMQGFDAGANDYMAKPISKHELLARVRVQLKLSQLTHSLERLVQVRTADLLLTNRLLENSMQETAEAMAELLILEERNRIAGDIHDVVGHTLTTAIVQLEGAKLLLAKQDGRGFDKLLLAQELIRKGLEEIRESVRQINPSGDEYDLAIECITLLEGTAQAVGAEIIYDISPIPQLLLQQKKTIFHALKEGLTNGLRHGAGDRFRFTLAWRNGEIHFSLWNNGKNYEAERAGTGLRMMSQRVRQFGGTVSLATPDEGGCLLSITLPVQPYD